MKLNVERININNNTKLCIISDIHHIKGNEDKFYKPIIDKVKEEKPSFILIPGDIIDHPNIISTNYIDYLITFLNNLSLIAPVIISKGNHELKKSKNDIQDFYKKIKLINNLYVLDNKSIVINDYQFIGFSPSNKSYLRKYKKIKEDNFIKEFNDCNFRIEKNKKVILLSHSPSTIIQDKVINSLPILKNIDYIICGHMHNGLTPKVIEPILKNRGIAGPEYRLFPKYFRGIFKINDRCSLIVCKSLRVLTKDRIIYKSLDKLYSKNITIINI